MQIRDRVKELRRVKAGQLRPNPKNWRTHPQGPARRPVRRAGRDRLCRRPVGPRVARRLAGADRRPPAGRDHARHGSARAGASIWTTPRRPSCWPCTIRWPAMAEAERRGAGRVAGRGGNRERGGAGLLDEMLARRRAAGRGDAGQRRSAAGSRRCPKRSRWSSSVDGRRPAAGGFRAYDRRRFQVPTVDAVNETAEAKGQGSGKADAESKKRGWAQAHPASSAGGFALT